MWLVDVADSDHFDAVDPLGRNHTLSRQVCMNVRYLHFALSFRKLFLEAKLILGFILVVQFLEKSNDGTLGNATNYVVHNQKCALIVVPNMILLKMYQTSLGGTPPGW